jgi:hypothetical protein
MPKTTRQKLTDEAIQKQIARHQKCWHRWVECRVIYRKLLNDKPDWFEWLENSLDGTHYSLTEETYNKIIKLYNSF